MYGLFYILYYWWIIFLSSVAPAPESVTNHIFELSKKISSYRICESISVDLSVIGKQEWTVDGKIFTVETVDSVQDYLELMKEVFDFSKLRELLSGDNSLKVLLNAMHGGTCTSQDIRQPFCLGNLFFMLQTWPEIEGNGAFRAICISRTS